MLCHRIKAPSKTYKYLLFENHIFHKQTIFPRFLKRILKASKPITQFWDATASQTDRHQRQTVCYENRQPRTNTNKHETIEEIAREGALRKEFPWLVKMSTRSAKYMETVKSNNFVTWHTTVCLIWVYLLNHGWKRLSFITHFSQLYSSNPQTHDSTLLQIIK